MPKTKNLIHWIVVLIPLMSVVGSDNNRVFFAACVLISFFALVDIRKILVSFTPDEKKFFGLYCVYILWGAVVSALSQYSFLSFYNLLFCITNILVFAYLINIKQFDNIDILALKKIIFVSSVLLLIFAIGSFPVEWLQSDNVVFVFFNKLYGAHGRIFKTTINIYIIALTCIVFKDNIRMRNIIVVINFIAGLVALNRFFMLFMIVVLILYYFRKYIFAKFLLKFSIVLVCALFLFVIGMHLLGIDLHVDQRFYIYQYWLPKIVIFAKFGTGLGLNVQHLVVLSQYPVSQQILEKAPFVVVHSHNLFVDKMIQSGVVGGLLYIGALVYLCRLFLNMKNNCFFLLLFVFGFIAKNCVDDQTGTINELFFWVFSAFGYILSKSEVNVKKL